MDHDEYIKRRDELKAIHDDSEKAHDNTLLQLSLVSLAAITAFIEKFGIVSGAMLWLSWGIFGLLAVSAITLLCSFLTAKWNMKFQINDLNAKYSDHVNTKGPMKPEGSSKWGVATQFLNGVAFSSFIIAIIMFATYAGISQYNRYKKKEPVVAEEQKGNQLHEGQLGLSAPVPKPPLPSPPNQPSEPPKAPSQPKK